MASKPLYVAVAVIGIAAASGAAWWYQNKPARPAGDAVQAGGPQRGGAGGPAPAGAPAGGPPGNAQGGRPPAVEVARVQVTRLVDDTQAVGALRSRQSVMLRPEVSGRVTAINFRDGEKVRRGQLLVQLDDDLPRAQIQQAQAELSIAQANHKRNQELVAQNFISQRSLDESSAALQVAQAKLALARAQADRLRIVAPFDGMTGIRNVHVGDYLKDGAEIVNLEDLDAVLVDFRLPERFQPRIRPGQTATVNVDALPGERFSARIQAVDPLLDANGRSVGVRGCIDNRHNLLRPGMFARVTAVFGERADARVVPEEALVPQGGRQFVIRLVDGPDQEAKIAQRVEVKVGLRMPGRVEILEGVNPGDVVVVAGQQRIQRDGMPVRVVEPGGPGGPGAGGAGGGGGAPGAAGPGAGGPGAGGPGAGGPGAGGPGAGASAGGPAAGGAGKPPENGRPVGPSAGGQGSAAAPSGPPARTARAPLPGPNPCAVMASAEPVRPAR